MRPKCDGENIDLALLSGELIIDTMIGRSSIRQEVHPGLGVLDDECLTGTSARSDTAVVD